MSAKKYVTVTKLLDRANKIQQAMEEVSYTSVYIGIPVEESSRPDEGEPINNAELAYIHEHGSPINNIPPRPFLKPSIKKNLATVEVLQKQMIKAALKGDKEGVKRSAELLGMHSRNNAKKYITAGTNLTPNKPATIKRKGSDKPLIDTGALLNSISYVVDDDRGGARQ